MTLTEFLLARIAEDEAVARAAGPDWINTGKTEDYGMDADTAEHVITFSPARVLAECEAKRRIVTMHGDREQGRYAADHGTCVRDDDEYPCENLRAIALPYADHPDYRDEWKP